MMSEASMFFKVSKLGMWQLMQILLIILLLAYFSMMILGTILKEPFMGVNPNYLFPPILLLGMTLCIYIKERKNGPSVLWRGESIIPLVCGAIAGLSVYFAVGLGENMLLAASILVGMISFLFLLIIVRRI